MGYSCWESGSNVCRFLPTEADGFEVEPGARWQTFSRDLPVGQELPVASSDTSRKREDAFSGLPRCVLCPRRYGVEGS
jgi:hypothetical protein